MHPGHIDPELTDRPRPDRARDVLQLRRDRIQCPGQTIIIEQTGLDPGDIQPAQKEEFDRDAATVAADLDRLRQLLEAAPSAGA